MQATGRLADNLFQARFDIHMNIFKVFAEREVASLNFGCDLFKTF